MTIEHDKAREGASSPSAADREELERRANEARDRLAGTLQALDHRRHDLMDPKVQLRAHKKGLMELGGGALLLLAGGVLISVLQAHRREKRLAKERKKALLRFWRHPEWIARQRPQEKPMLVQVARNVLTGVLTYALSEVARRRIRAAIA